MDGNKYYYVPVEIGSLVKECGVDELASHAYKIYLEYFNGDWSAEEAAEDYYDNHDGWEDNWPLSFRIWDQEGKWLGDYKIELDHAPTFNVIEVTE